MKVMSAEPIHTKRAHKIARALLGEVRVADREGEEEWSVIRFSPSRLAHSIFVDPGLTSLILVSRQYTDAEPRFQFVCVAFMLISLRWD